MAALTLSRWHQIAIVFVYICSWTAQAELTVQNYDRTVNLKAHFTSISETFEIKNTGQSSASSFVVCRLETLKSHESIFKVLQSKKVLKTEPTTPAGMPDGVVCVSVQLSKPVPADNTVTLKTVGTYTKILVAFPAEVAQADPQLMLFIDNLYAVSPYPVTAQTTQVELPTSRVVSITKERPHLVTGTTAKLGRYEAIKPFTIKELKVHFEHDRQFSEVTTLVKEIEVSHWGNIYVEEQYELRNGGAKHKGQFSRLKYGHQQNGKGNSFRDLRARLPSPANSLYYKDLIGNISSSRVRKSLTETLLDFELRYPLMGGWKVDFFLGYSLPLKGFLFQLSGLQRRLVIDFSSSINGVTVEDLEVRVVLPEGASDITANLPFDVEQTMDTKYTYLDTTGRPVLVLKKRNVVPEHNVKLEVDYAFNPISMLREPLLLVTAFAALFALVVVAQRWDFTISKDDKWLESQNREKIASLMGSVARLVTDMTITLRNLEGLASSATEAEPAVTERSAYEAQINTSAANARKLVKSTLEALPSKAAAEALEVLDKAQAAQAKAIAAVSTKVDLLKKSAAGPDVYKKTSAAVKLAAEARKEVEAAADKVFAMY